MEINYLLIFRIIIVFTILQRIAELFLSRSNEKFILSKGGMIIKERNYIFMVLLHTIWLICLAYFSFYKNIQFSSYIFWPSLIVFLMGQALRITAIGTLGKRWSTRVVILPEAPAVRSGIFKWFRHPNYLGVTLELLSLPLMASLFEVSTIFSFLNFVILFFRIRLEERNLKKYNKYSTIFNI
ncbi:isoprenylcysteine carboxylmethyltransferase family protein [Halobacteriovorax sp. JY17]|uniref:isoprenylcysteine carboxyl methyltransferase family protein n=1 Tax=Halobacteriovorax sp. JY17 TaxID=2014617 RepID=UPI000C5F6E34|nr:isoprenylcysteine carboxylmethyltransferase family protein [Halobacteriovorax sp. JY17]PIK14861.1 MAG: hypothetical protein CES88_11050 [Halobacteriovorax sp. JY17]